MKENQTQPEEPSKTQKASISRMGIFDIQVCVPKEWTDEQAMEFAESACPCGTTNGWQIRREGDEALKGCHERVPCDKNPEFVHIVLDA